MATATSYEKYLELLQQILQKLPPADQQRLVRKLIAMLREKSAAEQPQSAQDQTETPKKTRSIMELEGLGAELWRSIDSTEYLRQERDSWD